MTVDFHSTPTICFVGLANLPVLAREYGRHGVGGAELQQTLLAKALVARGYKVSMVVADYGQPDGAVWDGIKTYKAYRPNAGIPVLRFVHPRWTGVWSAMKRAGADIYYTSCAGALLGQVTLFARVYGARVIFRVASNSDCDPASLLIRYWRDKRLYRYGLRRADLVLSQTPEQQQALLKNFRRESRVAPSLTDTAGRRPEFAERDSVLWVGNIRALKRPELLLEAAGKLPHLEFHIIGGPMPGSESLYAAVRGQAAKLANVRFHGPVPYHEVGEFYERARVFVGTSRDRGLSEHLFTGVVARYARRGVPGSGTTHRSKWHGTCSNQRFGMCEAIETLSSDARAWEAASQRSREYMDNRFNLTRMIRLTSKHCRMSWVVRARPSESIMLESAVTSPYDATREPTARSVIMVGTDLDGMGGVRAVVRGYLDGGLFERYDCVYVASHRAGNPWLKITTALKAWVRVAVLLRKLEAPLVHVQTASRGSFWRKFVVCLLARAAGGPTSCTFMAAALHASMRMNRALWGAA